MKFPFGSTALLMAVLIAVSACDDSPTAPVQASVEGTWEMHLYDGEPVPVLIDGSSYYLIEGSMTVSDGLYVWVNTMGSMRDGEFPNPYDVQVSSTYSVEGGTVNFHEAIEGEHGNAGTSSLPFTGEVDGSVLITQLPQEQGGAVIEWRRQ
jgi:hypothetical protein